MVRSPTVVLALAAMPAAAQYGSQMMGPDSNFRSEGDPRKAQEERTQQESARQRQEDQNRAQQQRDREFQQSQERNRNRPQ
jgi:hypothetical protein